MNFDFDSNLEKLRSFLFVKRKASINAIQYVRNLPQKCIRKTLFAKHICPPAYISTAKVQNYFELSKNGANKNAFLWVLMLV